MDSRKTTCNNFEGFIENGTFTPIFEWNVCVIVNRIHSCSSWATLFSRFSTIAIFSLLCLFAEWISFIVRFRNLCPLNVNVKLSILSVYFTIKDKFCRKEKIFAILLCLLTIPNTYRSYHCFKSSRSEMHRIERGFYHSKWRIICNFRGN